MLYNKTIFYIFILLILCNFGISYIVHTECDQNGVYNTTLKILYNELNMTKIYSNLYVTLDPMDSILMNFDKKITPLDNYKILDLYDNNSKIIKLIFDNNRPGEYFVNITESCVYHVAWTRGDIKKQNKEYYIKKEKQNIQSYLVIILMWVIFIAWNFIISLRSLIISIFKREDKRELIIKKSFITNIDEMNFQNNRIK